MRAGGVLIGRVARILVASCPGCVELGRSLGVPVVHVDVAVDPAAALRLLNRPGRGGGVAGPCGSAEPRVGGAWRDWVEAACPSTDLSPAEADGRDGVFHGDGRLWVVMPPGVTVEDFRLRLRNALRSREVGDVAGGVTGRRAASPVHGRGCAPPTAGGAGGAVGAKPDARPASTRSTRPSSGGSCSGGSSRRAGGPRGDRSERAIGVRVGTGAGVGSMDVRIKVVNFGQVVSIRIDGADEDEVRRLLGGRGARRGVRASEATPAMVAEGVDAFLAQGDRGRLGAAIAEVWRAMERARGGADDEG